MASARLVIDLGAVAHNYKALDSLTSAVTSACVKADAYGLGVKQVVPTLFDAGCRHFFVATADEGAEVADTLLNATTALGGECSIYVFNGPDEDELSTFHTHELIPVLNSKAQANLWTRFNRELDDKHPSLIHVDTGINRLGFPADEWKDQLGRRALDNLRPLFLMSHLACAYQEDHPMNAAQKQTFTEIAALTPGLPLSLSNTGGMMLGEEYHFDMVRPGIGLYGGTPGFVRGRFASRPVVRIDAPILQIKTLKKGESAGYDATFTAQKDMRIAIVGAGYADGILRTGSNQTFGRVQGEKCPVIGRVSMDLTILDISHMPDDLGETRFAQFLEDDLEAQAAASHTISYELLTRLGRRLKRVYISA